MEAAISSSLSHPNIVQTYTYTIRPMRDNSSQQPTHLSSGDNGVDPTYETSKQDVNSGGSGGAASVHSYEVCVSTCWPVQWVVRLCPCPVSAVSAASRHHDWRSVCGPFLTGCCSVC